MSRVPLYRGKEVPKILHLRYTAMHFFFKDIRPFDKSTCKHPPPNQKYGFICERDKQFYILMTVHLVIILVNNQLDAQFILYIFISILYMFRATLCSSSGESNLVSVNLCKWPSGMQIRKELPDLHTRRPRTQSDG